MSKSAHETNDLLGPLPLFLSSAQKTDGFHLHPSIFHIKLSDSPGWKLWSLHLADPHSFWSFMAPLPSPLPLPCSFSERFKSSQKVQSAAALPRKIEERVCAVCVCVSVCVRAKFPKHASPNLRFGSSSLIKCVRSCAFVCIRSPAATNCWCCTSQQMVEDTHKQTQHAVRVSFITHEQFPNLSRHRPLLHLNLLVSKPVKTTFLLKENAD